MFLSKEQKLTSSFIVVFYRSASMSALYIFEAELQPELDDMSLVSGT